MARKKTGRPRGAPPGNMNAFKHGRRSRQLANAVAQLVADPRNGETFMRYAERAKGRKVKALEAGALMLQHLMTRAHETGAARARAAAGGQTAPPDQIGATLAELNGDPQHLIDQQTAPTTSPEAAPAIETDTETRLSSTPNLLSEENGPQTNAEHTQTAPNKSPAGRKSPPKRAN